MCLFLCDIIAILTLTLFSFLTPISSPYVVVYSHSLSGYQINCKQSFKSTTFKWKFHFRQSCHMTLTHHWPQVRVASLSSIKMIRVWKINLKCLTALTTWVLLPQKRKWKHLAVVYRLLLRTPATEGRARVLNMFSVAVSVCTYSIYWIWPLCYEITPYLFRDVFLFTFLLIF